MKRTVTGSDAVDGQKARPDPSSVTPAPTRLPVTPAPTAPKQYQKREYSIVRYPRLKSENIHPIDAPISRGKARELLVDYLRQIRFTSEEHLSNAAEPFDWAADEYDQKVDDKYFNAIDNTELEVELAAEEVNDLKQEAEDCKDNLNELKQCSKELAAAENKLKRHQASLEKAEARRVTEKSDYRKLLVKIAN